MNVEYAKLDRITDAVLLYRPPNKGLKAGEFSNKTPVICSFFAGAGFLDLGFEKAGFEIAYVNEYHAPFLSAYKYSRKK